MGWWFCKRRGGGSWWEGLVVGCSLRAPASPTASVYFLTKQHRSSILQWDAAADLLMSLKWEPSSTNILDCVESVGMMPFYNMRFVFGWRKYFFQNTIFRLQIVHAARIIVDVASIDLRSSWYFLLLLFWFRMLCFGLTPLFWILEFMTVMMRQYFCNFCCTF